MNLKKVNDKFLLENTKQLVKKERRCTLLILKNLQEIFARRLFSDLGYPSLFAYCTGHLGYSPSQAQRRINAAKLIDKIPEAEESIDKGEISLSSASTFQSFLEREKGQKEKDKLELLDEIKNKSFRETEMILAENSSGEGKAPRESKKIIKGKRRQIKFSLEEKEYQEMIRMKEELGADSIEELFMKLKKIAKEKTTSKVKIKKARKTKIKTGRYIPKSVKEKVRAKADGKCEICGSRRHLEFEHKIPFAKGGTNGVDNIKLYCRSCNQRSAIKEFGREKMARYISG